MTSNSSKMLNSTKLTLNSTLPNLVQVQAFVNGSFINVTLFPLEGIMNSAASSNKVYQMNNSKIELMQGSNLVRRQ